MDLTPFKNLVKEKCGLVFEDEKSIILATGIHNRISQLGLGSPLDYFHYLLRDQEEFFHLVNLLTINETYFFRESIHLRVFSERLIPQLLKQRFELTGEEKERKKIKILSAGCSTGEEPYSLVITLIEKYGIGMRDFFSVIAVDIDTKAIQTAKKGIYGSKSFRNLAPAASLKLNFENSNLKKFDDNLKSKYFKKIDDHQYEIRAFIKEMVDFQSFNLLSDFYPDTLQGIDIIFYRNVSIYFESLTQRRVFQKLSQILNEKGYLFMSSTETFLHNLGILSLIEVDGAFLYQKNVQLNVEERRKSFSREQGIRRGKWGVGNLEASKKTEETGRLSLFPYSYASTSKILSHSLPLESPKSGENPVPEPQKTYVEKRKDSHLRFNKALYLAKYKKYHEALTIVEELIEGEPPLERIGAFFSKAYTLKASILINLQQLEEAKKTCWKILEGNTWYLEGYLLLGLIAKIQNNEQEALRRFKEALYIQPSCWLAHFYLAEIYYIRGDRERACREYKIVMKLLEKGNLSAHGLTFFPLSFSTEQVIHLCHHNLDKLQKRLLNDER